MANDLTKNPWVVDTAGSANLSTAYANVRSISWVGGTTAGHEARVTDSNGTIFWRRLATGANYNADTEFQGRRGRWMQGLRVPNLDSGTLYITFDQE